MKRFDGLKHTIEKAEGAAEILLLTVVFYLIWKFGYRMNHFPTYNGRGKYVLMGVYFALTALMFYFDDGFRFGYLKVTDVLLSQWISMFIVNVLTYFQLSLTANKMIPVFPMLLLMTADIVIVLVCTFIFNVIYHHFYVPRNMLMIYGNKRATALKLKMDSRSDKYRISKLISADEDAEYIRELIPQYDAIVITDIPAQIRNDILKYCYAINKRVYVTPKVSDVLTRGADSIHLFDTPLLLVRSEGLNYEQRFVKRTLDIILSGIALIAAFPLMVLIAAAIRLEDGGPVFYKQRRVTLNNKEFEILKFRSMIVDAEKEGKSIPATEHDSRITRTGRIIRATRMDELPQILNILKGEMSIVGPRPERVEHVQKFTEEIPEFTFRTKVKGGLTGYAQIYGKYNTSAYDKLKLDLMYIENYSILVDLKLILMTVSVLFKKESTEGFDKIITSEDIWAETQERKTDESSVVRKQ